MADTPDLGSGSARIGGSSPLARTTPPLTDFSTSSGQYFTEEPRAFVVEDPVQANRLGPSNARFFCSYKNFLWLVHLTFSATQVSLSIISSQFEPRSFWRRRLIFSITQF